MKSPESPEDNYPSFSHKANVYDLYMDYLYNEEEIKHNEAMEELASSIERTALLSSRTWPNALHTIPKDDGEIVILSDGYQIGTKYEFINIIVNDIDNVGKYGKKLLTVSDFVVSHSFDTVAFKRSYVHLAPNSKQWDIDEYSGPVIFNRTNHVEVKMGDRYDYPEIPNEDKPRHETTVEIIDEARAAEQLVDYLSKITPDSYEEYISRNI